VINLVKMQAKKFARIVIEIQRQTSAKVVAGESLQGLHILMFADLVSHIPAVNNAFTFLKTFSD
jgi:hypothetical protein